MRALANNETISMETKESPMLFSHGYDSRDRRFQRTVHGN